MPDAPDAKTSRPDYLEVSFTRAAAQLEARARRLAVPERMLLARLLDAARQHPFIGDGVDQELVAKASEHIADHVKPSRRRAREVANRIDRLVLPDGAAIAVRNVGRSPSGAVLGGQLSELLATSSLMERFHLREILSNALGGLSPHGQVPTGGWRRQAWRAATTALTTGGGPLVVSTRPPFVSDDIVSDLSAEAAMQSFLSVRMALRSVAPAGAVARRLGWNPALCRMVSRHVGRALRPGNGFAAENATYLYYEDLGDCVQPHVDPFGITNALVLLDQRPPDDGEAGSALVVYAAGTSRARVPLSPGELVVLSDGAVVHSREPLRAGERVTLLSLVFAPQRLATSA